MKRTIMLLLAVLIFVPTHAQKRKKFKHPYGFASAFGCFAQVKSYRRYGQSKFFKRFNRSYFEFGPHFGSAFLMGDFGGGSGDGGSFIKDLDMQAAQMAYGLTLRFHPVNNFHIELGQNRMQLFGDDQFSEEKYRRRRDSAAYVKLNETQLSIYVHTGEIYGWSVHAGSGMYFYTFSGKSGRSNSNNMTPYSREGTGWLIGAHISKRIGKRGVLNIGAMHRSLWNDLLDNHNAQQNDAYFTSHVGFLVHFPKPKWRRVPSCNGYE